MKGKMTRRAKVEQEVGEAKIFKVELPGRMKRGGPQRKFMDVVNKGMQRADINRRGCKD